NHQRSPEPDPAAELIRDVSTQHENARMGKVEHAHHAEDKREPRGKHEQQEPVHDSVQERYGQELQHLGLPVDLALRALGSRTGTTTWAAPSCTWSAARWSLPRPWHRSSSPDPSLRCRISCRARASTRTAAAGSGGCRHAFPLHPSPCSSSVLPAHARPLPDRSIVLSSLRWRTCPTSSWLA